MAYTIDSIDVVVLLFLFFAILFSRCSGFSECSISFGVAIDDFPSDQPSFSMRISKPAMFDSFKASLCICAY